MITPPVPLIGVNQKAANRARFLRVSSFIHAVRLEDALRQVEPDGRDVHFKRSFSCV